MDNKKINLVTEITPEQEGRGVDIEKLLSKDAQAMTTKLDRLEALSATLLECKKECVKDADEWQVYDDMMTRVKELIVEEQRKLGYMAVYLIVDGQAENYLFCGTPEACDSYVEILLEGHPEMKGNIIIANI